MASYDMDDLIASFSTTAHISQEAVDLRALQAQLSSSLMMGAAASSSSSSRTRACPTTPTMGTMDLAQLPPSATPSPQTNVHHSFSHQHSSAAHADWTEDMMDEEMIEQSLLGFDAPAPTHYPQQSSLGLQNHYAHINHTPVGAYEDSSSFSSYAEMDPFFAAQLQAAQEQQLQQQLLLQQQQQQQASYFGGFAPARGFGARQQQQQQQSTGAFGSRF